MTLLALILAAAIPWSSGSVESGEANPMAVVTNLGFTAGYDKSIHCPRWVAYDLKPEMVVKGSRPNCAFRPDPQIGAASDAEPFYRSVPGFDRGHLCPSADMAYSPDAQRETFYYSNVCPQRHALNAGEWLATEEEVRRLAASGTVHVVIVPLDFWYSEKTGPAYARPTRFVKVAYGAFGAKVWEVKE